MRILGLDVGESRVGVAVSDAIGVTAQPLETVSRDGETVERLAEIVREHHVERIVVGLPLLMDGSEGAQALLVREFVATLSEKIDLPVTLVDERLTTKQAEAVLVGGKLPRNEKREAADRIAAALILQQYLESERG